MVNIKKYKNDGWGLSQQCLLDILNILNDIDKSRINVVEFGSDISTEFLVDLITLNNFQLNIVSFDNDKHFATKVKHNNLKLYITDLLETTDENFNLMFKQKKIDKSLFSIKKTAFSTKQRNCFYDIKNYMLPSSIDLVILDGPNGNGRSIAFLYLMNKMADNSYIVIDDYNHYDFIERFASIFKNIELIYELTSKINSIGNKWKTGGNYKIYKII